MRFLLCCAVGLTGFWCMEKRCWVEWLSFGMWKRAVGLNGFLLVHGKRTDGVLKEQIEMIQTTRYPRLFWLACVLQSIEIVARTEELESHTSRHCQTVSLKRRAEVTSEKRGQTAASGPLTCWLFRPSWKQASKQVPGLDHAVHAQHHHDIDPLTDLRSSSSSQLDVLVSDSESVRFFRFPACTLAWSLQWNRLPCRARGTPR